MRELAKEILKAIQRGVEKGGQGSGNFDHAGRPGKVGGSAPSEEAVITPTGKNKDTWEKTADSMFGKNNFYPSKDGYVWSGTAAKFGKIRDMAVSLGFKHKKKEKPTVHEPYNEANIYQHKNGDALKMYATGRANQQYRINYTYRAIYMPRGYSYEGY